MGHCGTLGYEVKWYEIPSDIKVDHPFIVMTNDSDISEKMISIISDSHKTFLFVQPGEFPEPWGTHPNFVSACQKPYVAKLNEMENVIKSPTDGVVKRITVEKNQAVEKNEVLIEFE